MKKIIVLDFGGQYTHLIANRIRRLGVYSEIKEPTTTDFEDAAGIILSGGPSSVYDQDAPEYNKEIFNLDIPILGLCYGQQLITQYLGGEVSSGKIKEYGITNITIEQDPIFKDLQPQQTVWMSHGDSVCTLPEGFKIIAKTENCPAAAITNGKYYGFQFHPEVTHSKNGMKMLENFLNICKVERTWDMQKYIEKEIEKIKDKIGNKKVFLLVSGGVDSMVCFALLNKALGKRNVLGLHIDHGLMRENETKQVEESLNDLGYDNLVVKNYEEEFLKQLENIYDPEEKRKIIGNLFIEVKDRALEELNLNPDDWILGQGTIYPDTIESGSTKNSALIKTHHNRVDIITELIKQGKVIEPLNQLYKDEVREVGRKLELPDKLIDRHPFPGPGLAIRCLCNNEPMKLFPELEQQINEKIHPLKAKVLPIKSVGVQGDSRTYTYPVAIKGEADWKELEKISTMITNEYPQINRVVYLVSEDVTDIQLSKASITKERLDLLRKADHIAMSFLDLYGLMKKVWQMPTVLIPINGESIVLRPIYSTDVMSASFADLPMNVVKEMSREIRSLGVSAVFYDITHKPPGTVEWE
jgi:GMP synthase (glutamine-hydrolysing)